MSNAKKHTLTRRDTTVLRLVHDYGLITTREIQAIVFASTDHSTMMRRLRKLSGRGYLLCDRGFHLGPYIWTLAPKGARALGSDLVYGPVNRNQLEHETTLAALRAHLTATGVCELWQPGFLLRKQAGANEASTEETVIPDALMAVRPAAPTTGRAALGILAIELELHPKAKHRYHKVFKTYRAKQGLTRIWYIVPHPRFGEMLTELWQDCTPKEAHSLFAWSLVESAFKPPAEIIVHSTSGMKRLTDIALIKKPAGNPAQSSAQSLGRVAAHQISTENTQPMNTTHKTNSIQPTPTLPSGSDRAGGQGVVPNFKDSA